MRRPVKPFVTEYRGGSRRQPGQGQTAKNDPFGKADPFNQPEPRAADPWPTPPPILPYAASQQQEDSYEAALRAADSLFAGVRHADPAPTAEPQSSDDETPAAHPNGGRVLRAVDEPPSHEMQEMMRLEAEFAPKKRGRKPGSKNKPKLAALVADWVPPATAAKRARPAAIDDEPDATEAHDAASAGGAAAARTIVAKVVGAGPIPVIPAPKRVAVARTAATLTSEAGPSGPRGERYAWVRTRLKPGQQWKRRLPKVSW